MNPACTEDIFQFFMMYFKNRENSELKSERRVYYVDANQWLFTLLKYTALKIS